MSGTPLIPADGPTALGPVPITIKVAMGRVAGMFPDFPSALIGVFGELNFDLLNHHRLSVIKRAKSMPGGDRTAAMIASRLHRYGRKRAYPTSLKDISGEGFAAAVTGETFGKGLFENLETGKSISTSSVMAMPIGAMQLTGKARVDAMARFQRQLANHELFVTKGGLLISSRPDQAGPPLPGRAGRKTRTAIVGVLARHRKQRALLGFYAEMDRILPKHLEKFQKAADLAATAAGQGKLAAQLQRTQNAREAGMRAYIEAYRAASKANPNSTAANRKIAKAASALARKESLSGGAGGRGGQ